ncbi:MAG TPA: ABC transporter permease [Geminicoccus sp.]|jgi:arginine/ornithine transport system permease protein|uniref:ABC transporter permease n=1 Tax=Geminicoccus sp. TaxID=2024832 RepID=UPI002E3658F8|nr:ABC transporter permease [Geminicoccus sp.]HEX2525804.1 ABC transporter permease [Geminicoccus sp.]
MDFSVVFESWHLYAWGLWTTLWMVAVSLAVGLLLAVPVGIMRASSNPLINAPAWFYTYCFTGTPLLVQLFLIYYGLGQFEVVRDSPFWFLLREAWFCALLTFVLNTAAYTAEILRGAIQNTPKGEIEAARACGMSRPLMLRRIILPSAFRRALPAYGNEIIFMLHGSSIASIVTIIDITGAARLVQSRFYAPFEAFITAGILYLILTWTITLAMRRLERSWFAHLRPREG